MKKHLILMISAAIIPLLLYACSAEEERALTSTTLEVAQSAIDFKVMQGPVTSLLLPMQTIGRHGLIKIGVRLLSTKVH